MIDRTSVVLAFAAVCCGCSSLAEFPSSSPQPPASAFKPLDGTLSRPVTPTSVGGAKAGANQSASGVVSNASASRIAAEQTKADPFGATGAKPTGSNVNPPTATAARTVAAASGEKDAKGQNGGSSSQPKVGWSASPEEPAQTTRRALFRFKDDRSAKEFVDIVANKRQAAQDIDVLKRLLTEKVAERQVLVKALAEEFGVEGNKDYEYDANALTIYRLGDGSNGTARAVHRELKDKAKGEAFARRAVSRRLTNLAIDVLTLLVREKDLEVAKSDQTLSERFSVVSNRTYQYDSASLTLYEILTVPGGAVPPADAAVLPVRK